MEKAVILLILLAALATIWDRLAKMLTGAARIAAISQCREPTVCGPMIVVSQRRHQN